MQLFVLLISSAWNVLKVLSLEMFSLTFQEKSSQDSTQFWTKQMWWQNLSIFLHFRAFVCFHFSFFKKLRRKTLKMNIFKRKISLASNVAMQRRRFLCFEYFLCLKCLDPTGMKKKSLYNLTFAQDVSAFLSNLINWLLLWFTKKVKFLHKNLYQSRHWRTSPTLHPCTSIWLIAFSSPVAAMCRPDATAKTRNVKTDFYDARWGWRFLFVSESAQTHNYIFKI